MHRIIGTKRLRGVVPDHVLERTLRIVRQK